MGQEADAAERCTNAVQVVGCSKSRTEFGYWAAVILGFPQVGVAGLSDSKGNQARDGGVGHGEISGTAGYSSEVSEGQVGRIEKVPGGGYRIWHSRVKSSSHRAEISLGEAGVRDELLYDRYRATGTGYLWIVQGTKTRHAASGHWLGGGCCELGGPQLGRKRI